MAKSYDDLLRENKLLREENKRLWELVHQQQATIARLEKRIEELEARLNINSKNSSKPPSSDQKPSKENPERKKRKPRSGISRRLLPLSQVTQLKTVCVENCPHCKCQTQKTGKIQSSQQVELPEITLEVIQIDREESQCPRCEKRFIPALDRKDHFAFGARLEALIHLLCSRFRQSHNKVRELLRVLLPSLSISKGEIALSKKRAAKVFYAMQDITKVEMLHQDKEPIHADCTGWRHCAKNEHLLVLVNEQKVFFEVLERQNRATLTEVLGTDLQETLVADRGFAYKASKNQSCLAHLKRNLVGLAEKIKVDPPIAAKIMTIAKILASLHHDKNRMRRKALSHSTWLTYGLRGWSTIKEWIKELLVDDAPKVVRRFFKKMLKQWDSFVGYLKDAKIPLTNNAAERALRELVIARKLSFGTKSDYGKIWVASIHGCLMTWGKAGLNVLEKLKECVDLSRQKILRSTT